MTGGRDILREIYIKGTPCVVASPAKDQHKFGHDESCSVQRTPGDGCLDRITTKLPNEEED